MEAHLAEVGNNVRTTYHQLIFKTRAASTRLSRIKVHMNAYPKNTNFSTLHTLLFFLSICLREGGNPVTAHILSKAVRYHVALSISPTAFIDFLSEVCELLHGKALQRLETPA